MDLKGEEYYQINGMGNLKIHNSLCLRCLVLSTWHEPIRMWEEGISAENSESLAALP